jgi:hypothetical protein
MMKRSQVILFAIGLLVLPLQGQTVHKVADINKKVVGKWISSDQKSYIEFLQNGSCTNGELFPDGKWHIEQNKLFVRESGGDFFCGSGSLTFTGTNTIERDFGMGGNPVVFHRRVAHP